MSASAPKTTDVVVLIGDLACFVIFAVLGLRSHDEGITLGGLLRAAVPFQAGWLVVAYGLRGRISKDATAEPLSVLLIWLPAWALGLVLRTLLFDRSFAVTFAIISFLFNAMLLLVWRSLLAPRVTNTGTE